MSLITKEEVLKVARMAHITLTEEEVVRMQSHLEAVLTYAARVQDLSTFAKASADDTKNIDILLPRNINVERDDIVTACDPEPIRAQAPEREGDYFVVPVIIEAQ